MRRFGWIAGLALLLMVSHAGGAELPDSEINPLTGYVESVGAPAENGFNVRHIEDPGEGKGTATTLSSLDAVSPRISIDAAGDSWVVWWRDTGTDVVYARVRDHSTGTWGSLETVSSGGEQSRHPRILQDDTAAWIVYQIDTGSGIEVAALSIIDSADPWPSRSIAATTTATGDCDARIHGKADHLWITWIDDGSYVGWTEFDYVTESWGAMQYESYVGGDVETARANILATVVGP